MPGRHDIAGDASSTRLLLTGPIVVRGLARGVRDSLRPAEDSRHRADGDEPQTDLADFGLASLEPLGEDAPASEDDARSSPSRARGIVDLMRGKRDMVDRDPHDESQSAGEPMDREDLGSARDGIPAEAIADPPRRARPSLRDRLGREAIGVAVLVVLALVCAGLIAAVVVKTKDDAARAAAEAANYTPPPLTTAAPAAGGTIAVIGDEGTSRAASGVGASERWPALLGDAVDGATDVTASAGAGYISSGANGQTFVEAASEVPADADVVLFVGGAADAGATSIDLAKAATQAFSQATERAPGAVIIAIGPLFQPTSVSSADLSALRTALRSSAGVAGARWVDPIAAKWLTSVDRPADLTAARERSIASRVGALVESASG